jgi:hypothetical protein
VLHDWWGLVRVVPGEVRGLLRRAKSGELTFQIRDPDAELLRARNERTVNRAMLAGYSMVAWGLFTWVLPQALEKPAWSALWWYSLGLAVQGLGAGAMATLSWLRSREL